MKLGTPEFVAYLFNMVMSSQLTAPSIRTKCPSISSDQHAVSGIRTCLLPGPVCVEHFCPSFDSNSVPIFKAELSFLQTIDGFCFLIHSVILSFDWRIEALIFKVIIEICVNCSYFVIFSVVFSLIICVLIIVAFHFFPQSISYAHSSLQPKILLHFLYIWFVEYNFRLLIL